MLSQLCRLPCLSWLSQLHVPALRAVPVVPAAPAVLVVLAVPDVLARLDNDHDWISGSPGLSGHPKSSKSPGFMISHIYPNSSHYWKFCCPNDRFVKTNRRFCFGNLDRTKTCGVSSEEVWRGLERCAPLWTAWIGLEWLGPARSCPGADNSCWGVTTRRA